MGATVFPLDRVAVTADSDGIAHAVEHARHVRDPLGGVGHFMAFHGRGIDFTRVKVMGVAA